MILLDAIDSPSLVKNEFADVAQLVARNLAKVQVAGSNPVVRSRVEWPRGEARDCKSRYTGSNPVSTSKTKSSHHVLKSS